MKKASIIFNILFIIIVIILLVGSVALFFLNDAILIKISDTIPFLTLEILNELKYSLAIYYLIYFVIALSSASVNIEVSKKESTLKERFPSCIVGILTLNIIGSILTLFIKQNKPEEQKEEIKEENELNIGSSQN